MLYLFCRTPEEFQAGHPVGATNIPYMFKSGSGKNFKPLILLYYSDVWTLYFVLEICFVQCLVLCLWLSRRGLVICLLSGINYCFAVVLFRDKCFRAFIIITKKYCRMQEHFSEIYIVYNLLEGKAYIVCMYNVIINDNFFWRSPIIYIDTCVEQPPTRTPLYVCTYLNQCIYVFMYVYVCVNITPLETHCLCWLIIFGQSWKMSAWLLCCIKPVHDTC